MPKEMSQFIVICLRDSTPHHPKTYTQASRKRMSYDEACDYCKMIIPSRSPLIVAVPWVETNDKGYPIYKEE